MKRTLTVLLTACLILQSWAGAAIPVHGAPLQAGQEAAGDSQGHGDGLPEVSGLDAPDTAGTDTSDANELGEGTQDVIGPEAGMGGEDASQPETGIGGDAAGLPDAGREDASQPDTAKKAGTSDLEASAAQEGEGDDPIIESALEVEVRKSDLFPYQGDVTVQVSGGSQEIPSQTLGFGGESFKTAKFVLSPGEYSLSVRAKGFAGYTQAVKVEEDSVSKLRISPERIVLDQHTYGWLRPGDVDGDGNISQNDTKAVLDAIRKGQDTAGCDINGDGRVDIADLQFVVQSLNEKQDAALEVQKNIRVQQVQTVEGTTMEGNIEDLLNKTGSVGLKPANPEAEISPQNPVGLEFALADDNADPADIPIVGGMTIYAPLEVEDGEDISSAIADGNATVAYVDETGADKELQLPLSVPEAAQAYAVRQTGIRMGLRAAAVEPSVTVEPDGSLVLDFGTQIAVKRVTITITGTKKTEPLVNIAKVEFVNDMENRIPAPQLDIPTLNALVPGDKCLTASWSRQTNVTGYEVYISGPVKGSSANESQIIPVSVPEHMIGKINDKDMQNFKKYTVKVRSVNGEWRSPWSKEQIGEPKPQKLPAAVDNVTARGDYRSILLSWKDMDDSNGYMVYYKKYDEPDTAYRPVVEGFQETKEGTGKLDNNNYTITGLEDNVKYAIYVKGWNELGWGPHSLVATAETIDIAMPELPDYKLLNTSKGEGKVSDHIAGASYGGSGGAHMVDSPLDEGVKNSAWGLVDNNYGSYWMKQDWDDGVSYEARDKGVTITLDQDYQMNYLAFAAVGNQTAITGTKIWYCNSANPTKEQYMGARPIRRTDTYGNVYYLVKFDATVTANKVRLCIGTTYTRLLKMGEIRFYRYDSLEDDIMGLYTDEMHTTLRSDVTESTIKALEDRLEIPDKESGEKHPLYQELKLEINTAREILNSNLAPSFEVDNQITAQKDRHLGFGGLNPWQPLGKVAYTGERLLVYVGHNTKRTGDSTNLQLVFTQHHSEANALAKTVNLRIGRNEITVPQITSNDFERGGQLYVAYTGNSAADKYAIRISGASDIPSLIVNGKTGEARTAAIRDYVQKLERYVGTIQAGHEEKHKGNKNENVDYDYDQTNCILNATDIMMDEMMYSVPATQIWAGIQNAGDKVTKLDNALKAMEDAMTLFYHHKGLSDSAGTAKGNNALPSQHLNIRYMRMFAGAFMYASGNHIGVEYGSTVLSSQNSMSSFGWGIAHEIGHDINQGTYAVAEVTNNYFAQLLTGKERYTYENVYKKVTSGTIGRASNVFTQLALYWQLHLAYDNQKDDQHVYGTYQDQFDNLFFARVDTYSRNPAKAPQAGLALNGGTEQNLMRLACAAANKNILPFFERWGMVPDEATIAYAQKYGEPETKALYYITPDARNYRVDNPETPEAPTVKGKDAVTASVSAQSNQVKVNIKTNQDANLILGYEISRSMVSNGVKETKVVGFAPIQTAASTVYTDTIYSINNRVMSYEVRAVDKYLNYSNPTDAGSAKIQTEGIIDKSDWTIETTMVSADDVDIELDEEDPDGGFNSNGGAPGKKVNSIERVLDNDRTDAGTYTGTCTGTATITVDMHKSEQVTALKYLGDALKQVTVEVSQDGTAWTEAKKDYTGLTGTGEQTIWMDSLTEEGDRRPDFIGTYDARYVRLTITPADTAAQEEGGGSRVSIREIEICGPSGDNLEFMTSADGQPAVGKLAADYKYGDQAGDVIPAGSLIFTGTYKGNPAYNVVILYDTEGNVIGAKGTEVHAAQVIFAEVPEHGELGETSNGTWVYYVEPGQWDEKTLSSIKGVRGELYRVDNALTLEGERIVSDTQVISIPSFKDLPDITLTGRIPE
ncbi:MAG: carbohydrate-binding protein [Lachnospiraceae bacterium]|nr:carbohydrate-binding protein [Lachnospiraceae bacterium]